MIDDQDRIIIQRGSEAWQADMLTSIRRHQIMKLAWQDFCTENPDPGQRVSEEFDSWLVDRWGVARLSYNDRRDQGLFSYDILDEEKHLMFLLRYLQ